MAKSGISPTTMTRAKPALWHTGHCLLGVGAFLALTNPQPAAAQSLASVCQPGAKFEVSWNGIWYPARARGPLDAQGRCPISYDGFNSAWDDSVTADRIRANNKSAPVQGPAPLPAGSDQLKVGDYVCTGYMAAILFPFNFKALPGRRYVDMSGRGGTYAIQGRTISFKGGGWDGRTGQITMRYVFTHYQNGKEIATCRPWQ